MYLSAVDRWSQYLITELFPSETLDPKKLCVQQAWATEPPRGHYLAYKIMAEQRTMY